LVRWLCPNFPSSLSHYALWSDAALDSMRQQHAEGCKLVLFSNQAQIKGAHDGKSAKVNTGGG
jgi:uncharacterized membrane protein